MAGQVLQFLSSWGPLWFGIGFLAPLLLVLLRFVQGRFVSVDWVGD